MKAIRYIIEALRAYEELVEDANRWRKLRKARTLDEITAILPWDQEKIVEGAVRDAALNADKI